VARVGEHLVKGTCHICHDATGPGGGRMMMMRGTIPSLASFPAEKSPDDLVRKVRYGTSGGMMAMMGGGRMPTFRYLTEEEVVAAYLYLSNDPPVP
jgi:mono/diheme cytochrome c family protein